MALSGTGRVAEAATRPRPATSSQSQRRFTTAHTSGQSLLPTSLQHGAYSCSAPLWFLHYSIYSFRNRPIPVGDGLTTRQTTNWLDCFGRVVLVALEFSLQFFEEIWDVSCFKYGRGRLPRPTLGEPSYTSIFCLKAWTFSFLFLFPCHFFLLSLLISLITSGVLAFSFHDISHLLLLLFSPSPFQLPTKASKSGFLSLLFCSTSFVQQKRTTLGL